MSDVPDITKPIELDYLYNAADKLYGRFARECGVSNCAYWMLYDLARDGGAIPITRLCGDWSYSKQTINSALKSLEARELIHLEYVAGSRRNKLAVMTDAGAAFAARHIRPAMEAEERAFCTLTPEERAIMMTLTRKYTAALEAEFARMAVDERLDGKGGGA